MKTFLTRHNLTIYLFLALLLVVLSLFLPRWSDQMLAKAGALYFFGRHFERTLLFSVIAVLLIAFSLIAAMTHHYGPNDIQTFITYLLTLFGGKTL
ncbi:hypothetical protein KAH37_08305 [bacterium]|nr:hypothetical protein [bacterium]